jgi:hypothetical protein
MAFTEPPDRFRAGSGPTEKRLSVGQPGIYLDLGFRFGGVCAVFFAFSRAAMSAINIPHAPRLLACCMPTSTLLSIVVRTAATGAD